MIVFRFAFVETSVDAARFDGIVIFVHRSRRSHGTLIARHFDIPVEHCPVKLFSLLEIRSRNFKQHHFVFHRNTPFDDGIVHCFWSRCCRGLCFGYGCLAACARTRSSCARSSGVNSAPKSSASNTWRISISLSSLCGFGQRFTQSMASCFDLTLQSQKPAISSFVSANGPSTTVRVLPENLT